jgi:hypothetical protein
VDVPAQHQVGLQFRDPAGQVVVREGPSAVGDQRSPRGRRVIDPDPPGRSIDRGGPQLGVDAGPGERAVPPRADGEPDVLQRDRFPVDVQLLPSVAAQPGADLFAVLAWAVQVVVTRSYEDRRQVRQPRQVGVHDDDLGLDRDLAGGVEEVSGQHDGVVVRTDRTQPVQRLQAIVDV